MASISVVVAAAVNVTSGLLWGAPQHDCKDGISRDSMNRLGFGTSSPP